VILSHALKVCVTAENECEANATIGVVGAALAAWLASAAAPSRAVPPPIVIHPPAIDSRGAELADEIARLHERLRLRST